MVRNIAVSTFVVILIQLVSIVFGQNSSASTNVQTRPKNGSSNSMTHAIFAKISKTSTASSSRNTSSSQLVMSSTTPLQETNSRYSTLTLSQPMSSALLSTLSSTTGNIKHTISSYSLSPTKSSGIHVSSTATVSSFVFAISPDLNFSTTSFTSSSTLHKVRNPSSSTYNLRSSRPSNSTPVTSSIHSSTLIAVHSTALIASSPSRTSSFSFTTLFTSPPTPFSTSTIAGATTIGITTITSNHESSSKYLSSSTQKISSTSSLVKVKTSTQIFSSTLFVGPTPSKKPASVIKSSEAKSYSELTKISPSTTTKTAPSSTANVLNITFLAFDGKLVLSLKSSFEEEYNNFKKLTVAIESVLDKALQQVNGYSYSKSWIIPMGDDQFRFKFDCMFKTLIIKPSSETATTLQEKINKYNETNGFGVFTLHSVETSVASNQSSSTKERLYLWAIIVIATLGAVCLLFLAAFIYTLRQLKKSRNRNHSSPKHDNNSNHRYDGFFPPVFDNNDESTNIPLQLTSVSSTESKKPLKLSDTADTDSEQNEENGSKSDKSSTGEDERKDDMLGVQKQSQPSSATLQIQESDDEDDQTKFSTFSRKR